MIGPVAIELAGQTEQKEQTEFRERKVKGREQTKMWTDWTWCQQQHASRDKSVQAFPPLFILQATKAGRGGLGTRLIYDPFSSNWLSRTTFKIYI